MRDKTSGFTLAEIMVGMAAASILMLASGSVLVSGNRTYQHYARSVRAGETGDSMTELVKTKIRYAADIMIDDNWSGEYENVGSIGFTQDGNFLLDGKEAYGNLPESGLFGGCRITPTSNDSSIIQLEVYLEDRSGSTLYRSKESINLINMELRGETIDCRIEKTNGVIDSAGHDVFWFFLEDNRRYEADE